MYTLKHNIFFGEFAKKNNPYEIYLQKRNLKDEDVI